MLIKNRNESMELVILKLLHARMKLTGNEQQHHLNLKKGLEGEMKFDSLIANLNSKFLILNDLLLESNKTTFQIDSLLITQDAIIPFEVKNYEGNYYYQDKNFHICSTGKEITNPLHQLNRIETLLRQFLQKYGFNLSIKGYLTFVNPEFFLYNAPQNEKMIFPPQLNYLIKNLNMKPSNLNSLHRKLADLLIQAHISESPYTRLPTYHYGQLRKGITCAACQSFLLIISERKVVCDQCGHKENIQTAVVRSVEEFKLLFPDTKVTTNTVYDWCQLVKSKKIIWRILREHYKTIGYGQWSYYE
ncbi:nuclease-related domain-containing protein [Cytobacillus praedii]|uniref:NERD domain-containing protein n=1 Tax=Cytobacillus praedii TaxID=1742358 RepID=A0A4R1AZH0_9BACI|nr:nuclease-related domain-containing protein [Cytobacillus praedii]TCJ03825.1 NERD domain-containing protein [Cytobacillus praedii]